MHHHEQESIKLLLWKLKNKLKMGIWKLKGNPDFRERRRNLGAIMFILPMMNTIIPRDFGLRAMISMVFLSHPNKYSKTSMPNTKIKPSPNK
jgi:hypothetical protein